MSNKNVYDDSPFLSGLGIIVEEWTEGAVRVALPLESRHLNRSGVVNGGILATLMDAAGALSGLYCPVEGNARYAVTVSMTVNYIGQSRGTRLYATARRTGGGKKMYFAAIEMTDDTGAVLASGTSVHRYRSGSEAVHGVPRKKPVHHRQDDAGPPPRERACDGVRKPSGRVT